MECDAFMLREGLRMRKRRINVFWRKQDVWKKEKAGYRWVRVWSS